MNIKKYIQLGAVLLLGVGIGVGVSYFNNNAQAQTACEVDEALLTKIYRVVFHRPLDTHARAHLGTPVANLLDTLEDSDELTQYGALFRAMKAFEEGKRGPGNLSEEDEDRYLDLIDQALSNISSWAEDLPEQDFEDATIGPSNARQAIIAAYEHMNPRAKVRARKGLLRALQNKGSGPEDLPLPDVPDPSDDDDDEDEEEEEMDDDDNATSTDDMTDDEDDDEEEEDEDSDDDDDSDDNATSTDSTT